MSEIDSLYQNSINAMSPSEKIAKSIALFNWSREFVGRQIKASNPDASIEKLKLLVALQIYGGDAVTRSLIESQLSNVSD